MWRKKNVAANWFMSQKKGKKGKKEKKTHLKCGFGGKKEKKNCTKKFTWWAPYGSGLKEKNYSITK